VSFAGNGKQALAAAIAALVPLGGRLGVDSVTYPIIKSLTASLGIVLVPLPMDEDGLRPDGVEAAHRQTPLQAIYCQPVLHNPLGATWSMTRAADIATVLERNNIFAIEDHVYAFLAADSPPLAALTPQRSVVVDSLSKRLAPGLSLGFLIAPRALVPSITAAIRFGAWGPLALPMELSIRLMDDGTAAVIAAAKRADAQARQLILREAMAGLALQANPLAYHGWLTLPDRWRSEAFVTAAAQRGIAITPASVFAVDTNAIPNAVRIALASPPTDVLARALRTLAELARRGPEEWGTEG
jgi:DNA-binding transcriptional MocR family regulator